MLDRQRLEFGAAPGPVPGFVAAVAPGVAEGPVHAAGVAGRRDGDDLERAIGQGFIDAGQRHRAMQRVDQRHVVQDRAVASCIAPQAHGRDHAVQAGPAADVQRVDVDRTQPLPEPGEPVERGQAGARRAGEIGDVQRPGRRADQHLERKCRRRPVLQPHHGTQRLEHADLVGGARAPAHQHQRVLGAVGPDQSRIDDGAQAHRCARW